MANITVVVGYDLYAARALLVILLLSGCVTAQPQEPAAIAWSGMVRWIETDTPTADCDRLLGNPGRPVPSTGCYSIQRDGVCVVITARVRHEHDLAVVGHEIKHCRDGEFHGADGRWISK